MAPIQLPTKRINLEIIFWDLTILSITLLHRFVGALLSRLTFDKKWWGTLLTWTLWILAGLACGWFLGVVIQ